MHKVTFYPLGNADCCLVDLSDGKKLLFDYADTLDRTEKDDKRIDLPKVLKEDLRAAKRDYYDVVAFSHLDKDHIQGLQDFFFLEYTKKYQANDRIKINELWVPAALITETALKEEEAKIIRHEARHRLKEGKGIRVFSRPEQLKEWLEENGLTIESRKHLITDAGQLVPGFKLLDNNVEFFVHSPFASRQDDESVIDRNSDSLVLHATFISEGEETKLMLGSDLKYEDLVDIVNITKAHNNEHKLEWDIFKLPHHCSYKALASDKGKDITEPVEEVKWLFEEKSKAGGIMVSTSKPIPNNDDDDQPPHRQAAKYYKSVASTISGEFIVTMEYPKKSLPKPVYIQVNEDKAMVKKENPYGPTIITSKPAPRAGYER